MPKYDDFIQLSVRGEEFNYLRKLPKADKSESKTYVLKSTNTYLKVGFIEGKKFLEPSGSPIIIVGKPLELTDMIVRSIDHVIGYGYTITFE